MFNLHLGKELLLACRAILVESAGLHSYLQSISKSCNKIQWTILLYTILIQATFCCSTFSLPTDFWLFILMERLCMYTITMIYLRENLVLLMQPFQHAKNQRKRLQLGTSYPAADHHPLFQALRLFLASFLIVLCNFRTFFFTSV